jgi:CheY-like chemotaxis protein
VRENLPPPILVVDDDAPTQRLLQALLRRYGRATDVAANGAEAIALLRERDYALIVLDLMMPTVGGEGVVEFLLQNGREIPVVVCTAAGPTKTEPLDESVVKAVVRKPFDIDHFYATIGGLIGTEPAMARVLIVDDDLRARYVMRAFLDSAEVTEAETGREALELLRESRPDVVLLDLMLPDEPGEELLRKLRETVETSDIPVVVVTSRKLEPKDRESLLAHAAAVIYKGDLSRETLRQALQSLPKRA